MTVNEKVAALRAAAIANGGDGVLLLSSDPHSSEYLPDHYNNLPYFSGFTGENSTMVVTQSGSALWCDGRFYVQGDKQLAGTEIACMHAGAPGVATHIFLPGKRCSWTAAACPRPAPAPGRKRSIRPARSCAAPMWRTPCGAAPAPLCRIPPAAC